LDYLRSPQTVELVKACRRKERKKGKKAVTSHAQSKDICRCPRKKAGPASFDAGPAELARPQNAVD
jgi:hypothetical protein